MAVVGSVFMVLVMLMFDLGYQLVIDMALNIAVVSGSRYGVTGQGYTAGARDNSILSAATNIASGLINPSNLVVTMASYATPASFAAGGTKTTTTGASSQFVVYTYSYKAYYLTGFPAAITGSSYVTHTATSMVQNEPF